MLVSFFFLFFLSSFIILFFFLLCLQIFMWKLTSYKLLGNVFSIYKFVIIGMIIFFEIFFLSFVGFNLDFFSEFNLWFNYGFLLTFDVYSTIFFFFAMVVSWSIMQFGLDYMVDENGVGSFLLFLLIFLMLMFVLVFSGNFFILFVGWEGVGLMSFVLISWWGGRYEASSGSMQAVYYNRVGDAGLMMFLCYSLVWGNGLMILNDHMAGLLFLMFLLGVIAKSSQLMFHPWLPNAMEGPTPVSSLLHSSTMVMAGVYLLMRTLCYFEYASLVFYFGMLTCLLGGVIGMSHADFKKVVAYSTTSQLGFMMMILGAGWSWLCLLYMMIHAFFKAMIFMMSGVVIHMSGGIQDFRHMFSSLLINKMMYYFYFVGGIVMMGFPFLSAFWMKDMILEGLGGSYLGILTWFFFFFCIMLTGLYSLRLFFGGFLQNLVVNCKVMMLKSFISFYPFLRLVLLSLFGGVMLFLYFGPFGHFFLSLMDKYFALLVLSLSGILMGLFMKLMKGLVGVIGGYGLFFNPMWHKMFSCVGYSIGYITSLFDFIIMEFMFFKGINYFWSLGSFLRFSLVIVFFFMVFFLL
uniref:NADH:ubiquinone reductase (H(+)-translocating) n=1 Tax=Botryllus schlosseri TaxID=30301 RepID=A0A024FSH7_BOTSH|nr:NADH dehydrogenase subunit 5 [Botryllus schlosseri]